MKRIPSLATAALLIALVPRAASPQSGAFRIEEASISDMHRAIQSGQTTCTDIVQAYIDRVKAYNGTCTALVTADGTPIPPAKGTVRAGTPLTFPTQTVAGLDGACRTSTSTRACRSSSAAWNRPCRIRACSSSSACASAFPNAGQLNALETLNIRGERSVTCKGEFDAHRPAGPLPTGAPAGLRRVPQAARRAGARRGARQAVRQQARSRRSCRCTASCSRWKNWYDAKDMRATGGNDVNFAMDAPKLDSPDVADLRAKGAISFAIANAARQASAAQSAAAAEKAKSMLPDGNSAVRRLGRPALQPVRHRARAARHELRLRRVGRRESRACSICEQTSARARARRRATTS